MTLFLKAFLNQSDKITLMTLSDFLWSATNDPYNDFKVRIFWEDHKIIRNLHLRFDYYYKGQIYSGDLTVIKAKLF